MTFKWVIALYYSMSKYKTPVNIRKEVTEVFDEKVIGDFDEDMEMTVLVHAQKMVMGRLGKKTRELKKLDKGFNISHTQTSHKTKSKGKDMENEL